MFAVAAAYPPVTAGACQESNEEDEEAAYEAEMKRRSEIASGQARQKGKAVYAFTASDQDEVGDGGLWWDPATVLASTLMNLLCCDQICAVMLTESMCFMWSKVHRVLLCTILRQLCASHSFVFSCVLAVVPASG